MRSLKQLGVCVAILFVSGSPLFAAEGHPEQLTTETAPASESAHSGSGFKTRSESKDLTQALNAWRGPQEVTPEISATRSLQALGLCLGVFFIIVYFLKRARPVARAGIGSGIKVLERTSLSAKASLVRVSIGDREMILAVGTDPVNLIHSTRNRRDSETFQTVLQEKARTRAAAMLPKVAGGEG